MILGNKIDDITFFLLELLWPIKNKEDCMCHNHICFAMKERLTGNIIIILTSSWNQRSF